MLERPKGWRASTRAAAGTVLALCAVVGFAPAGVAQDLWSGFQDPPAEARPWVRWWWNGNRVTEAEILRELDLLQAAGVGGVEINPIALHEGALPGTAPALEWLGDDWNRAVAVAVRGARERGMGADLIVGSGWPFGGRFLEPGDRVEGVAVTRRTLEGPTVFEAPVAELLEAPGSEFGFDEAEPPRLRLLRLVPVGAESLDDVVDLTPGNALAGSVRVEVPPGAHVLYAVAWQRGFRRVMHGAAGADGPVLDHYDRSAVDRYLERMSDRLGPALGGRLGDGLRAMFCDSIELSGANWTDDLEAEFEARRGYALEPWLPFVLDAEPPPAGEALADAVRRARYDYSRTLVELFRERFIVPFHEWCRRHGTLSRYQAYGYPWLMGMLDGYLVPDIPEGDTWLYNDWLGMDGVRYAMWNPYAAAGGHLKGRRVVSSEAITNTRGVFRATLEYMKQGADLSYASGMNHLVLHGYNYSPPEAGLPGWIRYGTWLNEQNPWWPWLREWNDYNARISWALQQSRPVVEVAILGPRADIWRGHGLERNPFVHTPEYLHLLWQAFRQVGVSADYVSAGVLQDASFEGGRLRYGPMAYRVLVVVEASSLEPEAAEALERFAAAGGTLVFVGSVPDQAPGLRDAERQDARVREALDAALAAESARRVSPPGTTPLREWTDALVEELALPRAVTLSPHDDRLFQVHHRDGEREVYFLNNADRGRRLEVEARFPTGDRVPWRWDPETGERRVVPFAERPDVLRLRFEPLESMLLVFEPGDASASAPEPVPADATLARIEGPWTLRLEPVAGDASEHTLERLVDLGVAADPALRRFGGTATYTAELEAPDRPGLVIDLGRVYGASEVILNGRSLGTRWWGRHLYPAGDALRSGRNRLEVRVATVVFNHARHSDDAMFRAWVRDPETPEPTGLVGPVTLRALEAPARAPSRRAQ